MRLINHYIKTEIETGSYMLINTLFGSIDILDEKENSIFEKWLSLDDISAETVEEREFFSLLANRGYFVKTKEEEKQIKEKRISQARENHIKKMKINHIVFVMTYDCNFACPYCFEQKIENKNDKMTIEKIDKILQLHEEKDIKAITLFGGEPLLLENYEEIQYILNKLPDKQYLVITNGYYLEEYLNLFLNKDIIVQITVDGPEEVHNISRICKDGTKTFDKIWRGINQCLKNGITVHIRMNMSEKNKDTYINFREKLYNLYKEEIISGRLKFEMQPIFQIGENKRREMEGSIIESDIGKCKNMNTAWTTMLPIQQCIIYGEKFFKPLYCHCNAEESLRIYDPQGNIYSCAVGVGDSRAIVGTYNPKFEMFDCSILSRNIETISQCKDCILSLLCGGGCAYAMIQKYGSWEKPNCKMVKYTLKEQLPRIYKFKKNKNSLGKNL